MYLSNQKYFNGGAARSLYELLEHLDRQRVNPYFASIYNDKVAQRIKELEIPFFQISRRTRFTPPLFAFSNVGSIIKYIHQNKIDIIHNNQCDDALYSWLPAKLTSTPIIIHHRDPSFYKRSRFLMKYVDANIAISSWQNRTNLSNNGIVIHNGIDLKNYPTMKNEEHHLFEPDNGKTKVGLLGRIMPYKAQDIYIKAAALVLEKYNNVQFLIIGDDHDPSSLEYIESLKSIIRELRIQEEVLFTGYIPESWTILPELDISVVPSRKEPFGRVTIESMACAIPVIATNVWGALDIVTPETGILIPPDDPEALAEAILVLLNSPEKRRVMGEAGRKRVEEFFTIDFMMQNIYKLYDEVLAGRAHH